MLRMSPACFQYTMSALVLNTFYPDADNYNNNQAMQDLNKKNSRKAQKNH